MSDKIFGKNNPNHDALVIPEQLGGTSDDKYFGSIGDATMNHLYTLDHSQRQIWEELICMRDGNIFREVPNFEQFDSDPMALSGKELNKLKKELAIKGIDIDADANWKEALEVEEERREQSEDIMDMSDRIPYHDWEKFPGLEKHVEMPSSPPKKWVYMGNTRQKFYDYYPEGHPDTKFINQFINMIDKDWMDDDYLDWVQQRIYAAPVAKHTRDNLFSMVKQLKKSQTGVEALMRDTLVAIDNDWGRAYLERSRHKNAQDPINNLLDWNEKKWEAADRQGYKVLGQIKHLGYTMFSDPELKAQMNRHHWHRYKTIKAKYSDKILFRGYDLNRCGVSDLMKALQVSDHQARNIWFARPFLTLAEMHNKGYISKSVFSVGEFTDQLLETIENAQNDRKLLSATREKIKQEQRDNKMELSQSEWRLVWSYYNIVKTELTRKLNEQWKEKGR